MKSLLTLLRLTSVLLLSAMPMAAHAGGRELQLIFLDVIGRYAGVWFAIAFLVVTIIGFTLMVSQDEGAITKSRSALTAATIGIILTVILTTLGATTVMSWIYDGSRGTNFLGLNTPENFGLEAAGVASWIAVIAAVAGIITIIIAATRAVLSFGDEGQYTNVRTSLLHIIIGIIVVGSAIIVSRVFFTDKTPASLLNLFLVPLNGILAVIGVIVVGIIIYAGFRMVISFGKEDEFTAARSLIFRALIGLVILLVSFTLISVVQKCMISACTI